jgi:membrane protease YdiL (CAAX protease family)
MASNGTPSPPSDGGEGVADFGFRTWSTFALCSLKAELYRVRMVSQKPWNSEAVVRLFLGIFATLALGVLLASTVDSWGHLAASVDPRFLKMFITSLAFQGAALIWVFFFLREQSVSWSGAFGFGQRNGRAVVIGVMIGLLVIPAAWMIQQLSAKVMLLFELQPVMQTSVQQLQGPVSLVHRLYFAVVAIFLAPLVEEVLFRGIIYPTVKQAGFPKLALWGTSLLFALIHGNLLSFLPLVFLALIFTWLYEQTDNLLASIVTHACFNAANFFFITFYDPLVRLFVR